MTPDSSVIIAAFAPWHERHDRARDTLTGVDDLVAHAELEAYSVLTRLPAPFRVEPPLAADYLRRRYSGERFILPGAARAELIGRLAAVRIAGGAVYDALIAVTAAHHGQQILSCDVRAARIYQGVGAPFEVI